MSEQETELYRSVPVGVVLERRDIDHKWAKHSWRAAAVMPGVAGVEDWTQLRSGPGWVLYHARTMSITLHRKETEGYKYNLSTESPAVYVILRPGEEADENDVEPALVTVCPYEAQDYLDSGEEQVDAVALPTEIAAWMADFIERHHVDEVFKKRKRKPHDPRKEGFDRPPPPVARGRGPRQ